VIPETIHGANPSILRMDEVVSTILNRKLMPDSYRVSFGDVPNSTSATVDLIHPGVGLWLVDRVHFVIRHRSAGYRIIDAAAVLRAMTRDFEI
jgi:hypothetical protein